ncbi:MAG: DUF2934 domain-containing protein [Solirubrobacteraceae bacterium]
MTEKTTKPVRPRTRTAKPKPKPSRASERLQPSHAEICERAYFIHLERGTSDELANWLRAEQELAAA